MVTKAPVSAKQLGREPSPSTPTNEAELGDTAPQRPHDQPSAVPKSFMASTWWQGKSPRDFVFPNPLIAVLRTFLYEKPARTIPGKVLVHSVFSQNVYIFPRAVAPILMQWASYKYFGHTWSAPFTHFFYTIYFALFSITTLWHLNRLCDKYGVLDNGKARDGVPDTRVLSTVLTLLAYAIVRPLIGVVLAYDRYQTPYLSLWMPVHAFAITVIVDFYFYIYHRSVHEIDWLWRFHKTHHMAKRPSSVLSAFADPEQDFLEIVLVPALTLLTYKVDFYTWWFASIYVIYVEAAGHSGARLHMAHPISGFVLSLFGMELIVEDHDLHHRQGWRTSANYGKQSRVWDRLFGTVRDRVECTTDGVDWNHKTEWVDCLY